MERREILAQLRRTVRPDTVGQYCLMCGRAGLRKETTPEGEIFVCNAAGHRSPRAFLFDGRAVFWFENGELIHEAAGAVIRTGQGNTRKTLLFLRTKFPFRYTIPAGHIELGQDPEQEMRREVHEETGLAVTLAVPLWPEETLVMEDPCRRGADFHRWHVFEVEATGLPRLSDEGRIIGWYADDEIRDLAARDLLTEPVRIIFARLGLIDIG